MGGVFLFTSLHFINNHGFTHLLPAKVPTNEDQYSQSCRLQNFKRQEPQQSGYAGMG